MERYEKTENYGPSEYEYNFDFDLDLRLTFFDYLRLLPFAICMVPAILVLELFSNLVKRIRGKREEAVSEVAEGLQPVNCMGQYCLLPAPPPPRR